MNKFTITDSSGKTVDHFNHMEGVIDFYSKASTDFVKQGRWVYKLVGKLELSEGKPKPFEVGKTYRTKYGHVVRIASTRLNDGDMLGMVDRGDYESYAFFTPEGRRTGSVGTDVGDLIPEKSSGEVILQPSDDGE